MKRFVLFIGILFVIFISGCSIAEIGGSSVKIKYTDEDLSDNTADVSVQIPTFEDIYDKNFQTELNEMFKRDIYSNSDEFKKQMAENNSTNLIQKPYMKINCFNEYNKNDFLSMVTKIETYSGGAHGLVNDFTVNADLIENRIITLSDLFKSDFNYKSVLEKMLNDIIVNNPDEYGNLWKKPEINEYTDKTFFIKDGKLIIFYQPYELAAYVRGFVEFQISLEDMKMYLNEKYYKLIE